MPAPVFYSVCPFGTDDIKVAANITITSGVATLTVAQTGNIGVGCQILFNTDESCWIAPNRIGFDSGGTVELLPDTKIEDATSGATGIVRYVEVLSGTWGGGDAAGWIYFESTTGTFGNNNIINRTKPTASANIATVDGTIEGNIGNGNTEFVVKSAIGADAADQTIIAVDEIHHEYASLSTLEAGFTDAIHINNVDLTDADVVAFACCYYDHDDQTADTVAVVFDFGTTDATRYLCVYTPVGGAESINSQRHEGVYDADKYIHTHTGSARDAFAPTQGYTRITGLQIWSDSDNSYDEQIDVKSIIGVQISCCIIWYKGSGNNLVGLSSGNSAGKNYYFNNIIYDIDSASDGFGINMDADSGIGVYASHNTVYNCTTGLFAQWGNASVYNNLAYNNTTDFSSSSWGAGDYNFSKDDSAPGANSIHGDTDGDTPDFVSVVADSEDFNLQSTSDAIDAGTSLAASEGIWRDIAGNERHATTPCIGAFEYVAAGGTTVAPTTSAPTTTAPTTLAPTTLAPTTLAPTSLAPTTISPTTLAPTTLEPTTLAPTTLAPTTIAPTTTAPTTLAPTTLAPTSLAPTTLVPTTIAPTTLAPTTIAPTSLVPTTIAPTTLAPTTLAPTTTTPTTVVPTSLAPTSLAPTTLAPTTVLPTTLAPTTLEPTTLAPTTLAPTTLSPTTLAPTTLAPTTLAPTTLAPTTISPTTLEPTTLAPTTLAPTTMEPTTLAPTSLAPTTLAPTTMAPTTLAPTSLAPTTVAPTTCTPASYVTDFSEYTTDSTPGDWTLRWDNGDQWFTIRDDGDIGGKCLECRIYESTDCVVSWDDVGAPTDVEVLCKSRISDNGYSSTTGVVVRGSGSVGSYSGYLAHISDSDVLQLRKRTGGALDYLIKSEAFTVDYDTWYWIRFRAIGTSLKVRVWEDGDAEPGTWLIDETDSDVTGSGWVAHRFSSSTLNYGYGDCDYFSVGVCGDDAGTVPPTTVAPTTIAPTTLTPTTGIPTTLGPTTLAPTSLAPTTLALTTTAPTTLAPTTLAPTTLAPTSLVPTTSAPTIGTVCWGHDTGVVEDNIRNFNVNWTGTGQIVDAGVADTERILFDSGESEESETWHIGSGRVRLTIDKYDAGFGDPELKYKQGNSEVNCEADIWHDYTIPFVCSGWIKVKISAA